MDKTGFDKLIQDLQRNPELLADLKGRIGDLERALQWVRARGYDVSKAKLAELAASDWKLSKEEMEQVAGGEDAWRTGPGGT